MKSVQSGFTLIELVMVIVILGVLAAIALPKFVDLKGQAEVAAVQGVAGALSSAAAINYAAKSASAPGWTAVDSCADVKGALQGGLPAGYDIAPDTAVGSGASVDCTVTNTAVSKSASFSAIGS